MNKNKVQIGQCRYNPKNRVLTYHDGSSKKLSHVPSELLELLYNNSHKFFSLEELKSSIWSGKSIENTTITRCVSTLRKDLKDSNECPYIENKRNQGYRFIAEVKPISFKNLNYFKLPISISTAVTILVALYLNYSQPSAPVAPQTLTTLIGQEVDGNVHDNILIFSHKPQGMRTWELYAKTLDTERTYQLKKGPYNFRRAVSSPEGDMVAYQQLGNNVCNIIIGSFNKKMMFIDNEETIFNCLHENHSVSITWKDNQTLYLSYRTSLDVPYSVYEFNIKTKVSQVVTHPSLVGEGDYYVSYSQALQRLVFFRNIGDAKTEIWLYNPKTKQSRVLADIPLILFTLAWVNNSDNIIVKTGTGKLSSIDTNNNSQIKTLINVNYPIHWLFSINDNSIGYVHGLVRIRDIAKVKIGEAVERIASSSSHDYAPMISQESGDIAFISDRSGNPQIWYMKAGSEPLRITDFTDSYHITNLTISNDGSLIAYTKGNQIHLITSQGKPIFSSDESIVYENAAISADNNILYYTVFLEEQWRIEQRSLANVDTPINLVEGYVVIPCETTNCFYFTKFDGSNLYKWTDGEVANTNSKISPVQYADQIHIKDDIVFYVEKIGSSNILMKYDMKKHSSTQLTKLPTQHFSYDLTNNVIYSSNIREGDTFLEQVNISEAH